MEGVKDGEIASVEAFVGVFVNSLVNYEVSFLMNIKFGFGEGGDIIISNGPDGRLRDILREKLITFNSSYEFVHYY